MENKPDRIDWKRTCKDLEAECQKVPDGYVLVPMEPTAEQMEAVINRYCHYNDAVRDEYRTYNIERLRHDYIAAVAAAPKPEKAEPERKLNSEPTIAAPVAQEPTAFLIEGFDGNGKRVAAVIQQNADNARNSASVFAEHYPSVKTSGLYLAPPDQSAEGSMTPAASIFKDEVARLNAEVERLRDHGKKLQSLVDAGLDLCERKDKRIAELEAEVERLKFELNDLCIRRIADEVEQHGSLTAMQRIAEFERQRDVLAKLLCRYRNETPPGHQPHMIAHEVDAALASVKEMP